MKNFKENTFWAKAKEDKLEKPGLFDELTKTFAAKGAPQKKESGEGLEKKTATKKKGKDLKIIDPKSAQNLCKYHKCNGNMFCCIGAVSHTEISVRNQPRFQGTA